MCCAPYRGAHTHTAGASHDRAEDTTKAAVGGQANTLDDGQPEHPKGKRRKTKARVVGEPERLLPDDTDPEYERGEVQP